MVAPLKVGIAGLGTVGAEVVRLIEAQGRSLSARCGRAVRVTAVTARSFTTLERGPIGVRARPMWMPVSCLSASA